MRFLSSHCLLSIKRFNNCPPPCIIVEKRRGEDMKKYLEPSPYARSYNCPRCGVLCPQDHIHIHRTEEEDYNSLQIEGVKFKAPQYRELAGRMRWNLMISICSECRNYTIWENDKMIYPLSHEMPDAVEDMPDNVLEFYNEAAQVYQYSKRAAAALLRLAIETLMIEHLNVKKGRITDMIGEMVKRDIPDHVQQGLDTLRYYGNKGIHLGEIDLNDNEEIVSFLFRLINTMVKELITEPKEIDSFYRELPETFRVTVEKRDQK